MVPGVGTRGHVSSASPNVEAGPRLRDGVVRIRQGLQWLEGVRPRYVLATLVAVEWLLTLGVALTVRHNGWLYYQGGDELWHYVTAWIMGQGRLPHTAVGYAWSIVLLPFALAGGPNLVTPLPFIVLLNVLVLMPVALLTAYGIGRRIGGRLFGYWVAALWILVPLIGIKYADAGYHQRYTELLLPQSLGLTAMSDFPSMVASIVAAYFALRAVQDDLPWDGVFAGLFTGIALGIKPSNAPLLVGIGLALLVGRRIRSIVFLGVGLAPGLLALAVWKARGEGNLPVLHGSSGGGAIAARIAPVVGGLNIHKYAHPSWSYFMAQLNDLEQHFWSLRLLEWLAIAGTLGLLRRSRPLGVLFGGWFFSMIIVKWMTPGRGTIADSDLLRQSISTIPAALVLLAGLLLLFPGIPHRLRAPDSQAWGTHRLRIGLAAGLVTLFGAVPLGLAAGLPLLSSSDTLSYYTQTGPSLSAPFPTDPGWRPTVTAAAGGIVRISWKRLAPLGGTMDYNVLRAPGVQSVICPVTGGGAQCRLNTTVAAATRGTSFVDRPPAGRWVYRVVAVASWINDPTAGNIFVAGSPVTITVRR